MAIMIQVCGDEVVVYDPSINMEESTEVKAKQILPHLTQFTLNDLLAAVEKYKAINK